MKEALKEAEKALEDNEFPVGCVIVYNDEIIARGRRLGSSGKSPGETDHAEINTIKYLHENHPELEKNKMTIYSTMEPCMMCFSAIMLSGFKRIVYAYEDAMGGGCWMTKDLLPVFYKERFPEITKDVMRKESLELFKIFFNSPNNIYWKGSYLAQYTLNL